MIRFSKQELSFFVDSLEKVLENDNGRKVFKAYLKSIGKHDLILAVKLWKKASKYLEDKREIDVAIKKMIWEIDDFDADEIPGSNEVNLNWIKMTCINILEKVHRNFSNYVIKLHSS